MPAKNKKILVVDDDPSIIDALCLILTEEGFTVDSALKGEETYTKIQSFSPDLILLDVLMSGQDGREICRNLKKDGQTKKIPIIMLSAHPSAKTGAQECGADDFLAKPFDISELVSAIAKYI